MTTMHDIPGEKSYSLWFLPHAVLGEQLHLLRFHSMCFQLYSSCPAFCSWNHEGRANFDLTDSRMKFRERRVDGVPRTADLRLNMFF